MYAMTAAHPTLPIPSYVRVTRVSTGKTVVLRVNDRGPFLRGRVIDLSYVAAYQLGVLAPGSAEVIVERIMPEEIRNWRAQAPTPRPEPVTVAREPRPEPIAQPPPQPATSQQAPVAMASNNFQASTVPSGRFYLQAGAFSDPARAQSLATVLTGKIPADLGAAVNVEQSANNLYRVRIGPFANREAATQASERLQSASGLTTSLSAP
jgi:rare lipoprotein A